MDLKEINKGIENINLAANACFMSHQLFAAREIIAQKLDRNSTVKGKFKEKIQEIYKDKDNHNQHEAYIDLELAPICNDDDEEFYKKENSARIYVNIDKINPVLSESSTHSYALRLTIVFSKADTEPPYNGGYIDKKCSRFIICHELGHSVLHLDSLIEKAVGSSSNKSTVSNNNNNREEEANVFADVLSDLRDAHLLGKGYELNIKKIRGHKLNTDILEKIVSEAKEVDKCTTGLTMSHVTFAVSDIINKNLRKEKSKETINIYLTAKNGELVDDKIIINYYKRRQKENFYIFELRLNNQKEGKPKLSSMEIETCKAIGCIYFYFSQMKEIVDKGDERNACRPTPKNVSEIINDIEKKKEENFLKTFAEGIYEKRKESLKIKKKEIKNNKQLKSRLKKT